jgi:2-keto-4-pentenoate hydratase
MSVAADLAARLLHAARVALPLSPADGEGIDVCEGYGIQNLVLQQRQAQGETLSGWKVAFAGSAAQQRFALSEPVYGALTQVMHIEPGSRVDLSGLIQPKLEVELAFVLGRRLPPGEYRDDEILATITAVAPAFEIADSRWLGWRFTAGAFLADNAAAALYCLGPAQNFEPGLHAQLAYRLECNGDLYGEGTSFGRGNTPVVNLCWLVRRLLLDDHVLEAGQVILSGALLPPLDIQSAAYRLEMLGTELALQFEVTASTV